MRKIKYMFLLMTIIILIIPIICFNFKADSISKIDNRKLADIPQKQAFDDYLKSWDTYLNDRIGHRDTIITQYTKLNDFFFHELIHPSYQYGKDGHIFRKLNQPFHDYEYMDSFMQTVVKLNHYCEQRNIPFLFVLNPGKDTIYPQYLPNGYNYINYRLDYLYKLLKLYNIPYVDNVGYLNEIAKKEQIFNVKYDAGHWNDLGAYYGINHILEALSEQFTNLSVNTPDMFLIGTKHASALPVSNFEIDEIIPHYQLKDSVRMQFQSLNEEYKNIPLDDAHQTFSYNFNRLSNNKLRGMYFQGSYLNTRAEMLWPSVEECINIHAYENVIDFDYYINLFQPDFVVFETVEYTVIDSYYNKQRMTEKSYQPALDVAKAKRLENKEIQIVKQGGFSRISVKSEKKDYAYMKMGNQVYDLFWDSEENKYYVDVRNSMLAEDYEIWIMRK